MPFWIPAAMSLMGGLLGAKGQRDSAGQARQDMSPQAIQYRMHKMNPWMRNVAMAGKNEPWKFGNLFGGNSNPYRPDNPHDAAWFDIATNPGHIDPSVMNTAHEGIERTADMNQQRARGSMGRSSMGGGMARAYELANYGTRTLAHSQAQRQFELFKEEKKRSDLQMVQNAKHQAQQAATGVQTQMAQTQPMPWSQVASNAIIGGLDNGVFEPGFWTGGTAATTTTTQPSTYTPPKPPSDDDYNVNTGMVPHA